MSEELEQVIKQSIKGQSGILPNHLELEFVSLCQDIYNYRPNMSCGKCIFKYINKIYNDKIKSN
jgi:ArsR family metal-binding transcriptional regulator